ncbi:IspD/TarI family cytidylyltransferase [Salininema proteolyticum]|uniref:2-C-methyl-D-erythritol 4-phosphate cytidylyltransferase n=1 Tax=Salininema proteolyticum TaxID=1607685 RepID=A0ABV8TXA6_9ACTN
MHTLLLLNGGIGSRAAAGHPKQFIEIDGRPMAVYSLIAADAVEEITQIVFNYPPGFLEPTQRLVEDYAIRTPVVYVPAGSTRHESVAAMLPHAENSSVIIHESARPMIGADDFENLIEAEADNVGYMIPISFTVAPVDPDSTLVTGSLDRDRLRNVQLPQKFSKEDLLAAHAEAAAKGTQFTEDATLLAANGFKVGYIEGDDKNIKVTTPTDVKLVGFLMGRNTDND